MNLETIANILRKLLPFVTPSNSHMAIEVGIILIFGGVILLGTVIVIKSYKCRVK